jgi:hypothetical protein
MLTLVIAGAHAVITAGLAAILNVWIDEAYTLETTAHTIGYAWRQAIHFEAQPPAYFLILTIVRNLYDSVFVARLFSIICTTTSVILARTISKQYLGSSFPSFLLPLLVAAHPFTVYAAVEVRRYGLVILLATFLLVAFHRSFASDAPHTRRWIVLYGLTSLLSLYTDYSLGFLLMAQHIVLLSHRKWRFATVHLLVLALVFLLTIPLFSSIVGQFSAHETYGDSSLNQFRNTTKFLSYSFENLIRTQWAGVFNRPAKAALILATMLGLAWVAYQSIRQRDAHIPIEPILITGFITCYLLLLSFWSNSALLRPYHFIVLLVPANLLLLVILDSMPRSVCISCLVVIVGLHVSANTTYFGRLAKMGDYARVARFIEEGEHEGEPIVVFSGEGAMPFKHHYGGINDVVPVPQGVNYISYDLRDFVLEDESQFWNSLAHVSVEICQIWVVTDSVSDPINGACGVGDVNYNCEFFEDVLRRRFVEVLSKEFYQGRVRYLERIQCSGRE